MWISTRLPKTNAGLLVCLSKIKTVVTLDSNTTDDYRLTSKHIDMFNLSKDAMCVERAMSAKSKYLDPILPRRVVHHVEMTIRNAVDP